MRRRDRGSVTVEFAMVLPGLALMLAAVVGTGAWAIEAVAVQGAAADAARVAVTDGLAAAEATALRRAGATAQVSVTRVDEWIVVSVTSASVWGLPVSGRAVSRAQE